MMKTLTNWLWVYYYYMLIIFGTKGQKVFTIVIKKYQIYEDEKTYKNKLFKT